MVQTKINHTDNGAAILAAKYRDSGRQYVLCLWHTDYVVWTMDTLTKVCESGRYFGSDFNGASDYFATLADQSPMARQVGELEQHNAELTERIAKLKEEAKIQMKLRLGLDM